MGLTASRSDDHGRFLLIKRESDHGEGRHIRSYIGTFKPETYDAAQSQRLQPVFCLRFVAPVSSVNKERQRATEIAGLWTRVLPKHAAGKVCLDKLPALLNVDLLPSSSLLLSRTISRGTTRAKQLDMH